MTTCTACDSPTPTGITLCVTDSNTLTTTLEQIPDTLETIEDTIAKLDKRGSKIPTATTSTQAEPPIRLDAMDRRRDLADALEKWRRTVLISDTSDDLREVQAAFYLRMSMDLIRHQHYSGTMLHELDRANRRSLAATDAHPDIIHLGACGTTHEGATCTEPIRATKGDQTTRCRTCGTTHNIKAIRQDRASNAWGHFDTLTNIVKALRSSGFAINPRSARRWAAEGHLTAIRYHPDGTALYSPGQVIDTHQRMKSRHGGRRVKTAA